MNREKRIELAAIKKLLSKLLRSRRQPLIGRFATKIANELIYAFSETRAEIFEEDIFGCELFNIFEEKVRGILGLPNYQESKHELENRCVIYRVLMAFSCKDRMYISDIVK